MVKRLLLKAWWMKHQDDVLMFSILLVLGVSLILTVYSAQSIKTEQLGIVRCFTHSKNVAQVNTCLDRYGK